MEHAVFCDADCVCATTHGTDDPAVRLCDWCGGIVPTNPFNGQYMRTEPTATIESILAMGDAEIDADTLSRGVDMKRTLEEYRALLRHELRERQNVRC